MSENAAWEKPPGIAVRLAILQVSMTLLISVSRMLRAKYSNTHIKHVGGGHGTAVAWLCRAVNLMKLWVGGGVPLGGSRHSVVLDISECCYETMVRDLVHFFHEGGNRSRRGARGAAEEDRSVL